MLEGIPDPMGHMYNPTLDLAQMESDPTTGVVVETSILIQEKEVTAGMNKRN